MEGMPEQVASGAMALPRVGVAGAEVCPRPVARPADWEVRAQAGLRARAALRAKVALAVVALAGLPSQVA